MREAKSFSKFLKSNWWFLLLGFSKAIVNSEKNELTNSILIDTMIFVTFLLILMFLYWIIRYKILLSK